MAEPKRLRDHGALSEGPKIGRTPRGHATACFIEGFLEGSLKEMLLGRVLRRRLVRVSIETEVLRRVLRRRLEGA